MANNYELNMIVSVRKQTANSPVKQPRHILVIYTFHIIKWSAVEQFGYDSTKY